jgi:Holliday junction resolvase
MSRGLRREREVRRVLEDDGWWTMRGAASKGAVDVVAAKATQPLRFVQVKSDAAGPFAHFGPAARAELLEVAGKAGAVPELAWWPPRGKLRFYTYEEWPG